MNDELFLVSRTMLGIDGNKIIEIDLLSPDVHITEEMTDIQSGQ